MMDFDDYLDLIEMDQALKRRERARRKAERQARKGYRRKKKFTHLILPVQDFGQFLNDEDLP
jgi:hypothetical protein